jgi:8-amino-7-oxononanoate synthase
VCYHNFASYNYLGLSGHPRVTAAAQEAIARWGTSVSASRLVAGERAVHRTLECALADFIGVDDAVAFVGGHATNVAVITHLVGAGDLVCCDERLHNSGMQGAQFSGARRVLFPHNDWRALDALLTPLRGQYRRVLVLIESVYSADGDVPDLAAFVGVKARHDALLMVDEAHGLGVLGTSGRGAAEAAGVDPRGVDLWMGTLSKALASSGGYIAGNAQLMDYLRHSCPGFVFSVGLAPAVAAAAHEALQLLREEPSRVERLRAVAARFRAHARAAALPIGDDAPTPIVPVLVGDSARAVAQATALRAHGVFVQPMIAPAVPEQGSRLRFFLSCEHTNAQIDAAVAALLRVYA